MQNTNPPSRVQSRVNSRAPSPTASVRSRRSRVSRRATREDEDNSEEEDRKSSARRGSMRSERRRLSQASEHFQEAPIEKRAASPAQSTRSGISRSRHERNGYHDKPDITTEKKLPQQPDIEKISDIQSITRNSHTRISPDRRSERAIEKLNESISTEIETDKLDAPPPPTPQHPWICEYCTFENEAGTRVCDVCCKTPTAPPLPSSIPTQISSSTKGNKVSSSESCVYDYSDAENYIKRHTNTVKRAPKASPESDSNDESMSYVSKRGRLKKISFLPGTK